MYTSDDLIADVRDQGHWADDDPFVTDARILAEANRVLTTIYAPAIRRARADFYIATHKVPIVTGQHFYRLPAQAVVSSVRKVLLVSVSGKERELIEMPFEDADREPRNGSPTHWTIRDGHLELNAKPTTGGYVHIEFEYVPGVLTQDYLKVKVLSFTGVYHFLDFDATDITTTENTRPAWLVDGGFYTAVRSQSPFSAVRLRFLVDEVEANWPIVPCAADTSWRFDGATLAVATVGVDFDQTEGEPLYLAQEGYSACPQIPAELHSVLAMHCAGRILRTIDPQLSQELLRDSDERLDAVIKAMAPRKIGKQMKIKGDSLMRRRSRVRFM